LKSLFFQNINSNTKVNYNLLAILLPLLAISLAYSKATVDVVLLPKFILYTVFVFSITLISTIKSKKENEIFNQINSNIFFKAYFIYCLISIISLANSNNFADGIFELLKIILFGIGVFSLSVYFSNTKDYFIQIAKAFSVLNFIIVLIGCYQFLEFINTKNVNHTSSYSISGTFGHKNIFSEMVFMSFPLSIFLIFYGNKFYKNFSIISVLLSFFLITVTLTRAVWLSTFLGFALSFPLYYFSTRRDENSKNIFSLNRKTIIIAAAIFGSIALGIFIYSRFDSFTTFKKQAISISGFKYGSSGERIELWKKSYKVFKESPIFGSGVGSWKISVLKYGHNGLETEDNRTFHQRPHNDFIWILCEQGMLGLLAYLFAIGIILFNMIQLILKSTDSQKKLFYFLCLYTFLGYLIFSFFSFPKERIEHQLILLFIFSAVIIDSSKPISSQNKYSTSLFLLFIFVTVFSFFIGFKRYKSEIHLQKAYTLRNQSNWQEVILEIRKAENIFYTIDPMCTPLVWYSGSSYYNLGEKENAFIDFLKAYEINPNHIHVLNNLATCYESKSDHNNAIKYYNKALKISPNFTEAKLNLIATLFNSKKNRAAYLKFSELRFDSTNVKYLQMMPILLEPIITQLADNCGLEPLKFEILAVVNVPGWSSKIFIKSKTNNITFEQQLLLDAIFSLDNSDKIKYLAKISSLKKTYGIKSNQ